MDLMLRIATVEIRNQDMSKSSPGNQAAIHWLEKEAADAGLATETKIEPRRYSGGNADLDETASLDFRKAHRIPPDGWQEIWTYLVIVGGGTVGLASFLRNVLGSAESLQKLFKDRRGRHARGLPCPVGPMRNSENLSPCGR